jgi:adenylylsulfate kinase-like enzyme
MNEVPARSGRVVWVTGLSGTGKTTLCRALWRALKPAYPELVCLDGDAVREAFGHDLGYREADRRTQIQRMQRLAKLLADQGQIVLVAALYAHPELLEWNRRNLPGYFEVHLQASLETLRARDPKDLYRRAAQGQCENVVGLDIPWHAPVAPDLVLEAESAPGPEECARLVLARLPDLIAPTRDSTPARPILRDGAPSSARCTGAR